MLLAYKKRVKKNPFHYSQIQTDIPIVYPHYEPASWQAEAFHSSDKHIKAIFGGDRSGKTGTVTYEMISLIRENPGDLFWCAALTEEKLFAVWEWYKKLLNPLEYFKPHWRIPDEIPKFIRFKNGAKLLFKTMKQGAGPFSADSVKAIHLDEDGARVTTQAERIFNDCQSRIIDSHGYVLVSATPILGKNWMYTRLFRGNQDNTRSKKPDKRIECWTVSLDDNKFIGDEEKADAKEGMSEDEIARRYDGQFITLSGACFKEFRASVHNLKTEPYIGADWRRIKVIDFGYEHPFYCGWYAYHDGVIIQYDEHHQNHTLLEDHASRIYTKTISHMTDYLQGSNYRPDECAIADHDAQERAQLASAKLKEKAIFTQPAIKDVRSGIQEVNHFLKIRDGAAHFYISPRCPVAQIQFETYHFKKIMEGNEEKEIPHKVDDEAPDCGRYAVMYFKDGARNYGIEQ